MSSSSSASQGSIPKDKRLPRIFSKYDKDGDGLDKKELRAALAELNVKNLTDKDLEGIILTVDVDGSGALSLEEFTNIFGVAKLKSIFQSIDRDGSGFINSAELSTALEALGYKLPASEVKMILKKVDADSSGEVSFDEFKTFFQYVPATSLSLLVKSWTSGVSVDCGSDLSPPTLSPSVPWYYGVFGGLGGVASRTLTAPLEKVKIQAQTSNARVKVFESLRKTYTTIGFRGLFAGNLANCLRVFPMAGLVTFCYLSFLQLTPADNDLDPMEPVYRGACAASAGIVGQLFTYPIDIVRARLTVMPDSSKASIAGCFKDIIKEGGTRALYKGLTPTLFAVAPFLACQMSTADACKSIAAANDVEVTPLVMLGVGGTAGIAAQTVVYPLDVLRRRMQVGAGAGPGNANVISDSTWTAMREVVKREGFRSLFAGIVPTYMKVFPAVAIAMTTT
eukprot:CAMPEP_0182477894 /NCGR_PEP_ID=MMETSP1319-20130603/31620_1 /TAXON_ID=172717 /ORGANISM="Bolidomonas pacifica, Strain RCC208" /LENGTH=450 /DNA_ID=CAMNT_0024679177 /DNA_START=64 /DNA_END=1412 /DNA_ORIENTATION=+